MLSPDMAAAGADQGMGSGHGCPGNIRGPVVLYVGRLEPNKGVPLLLGAACRVLAEAPDANLVLAGGNHPTLPPQELERLLSQVPHRDRIHVLGHVPWRDLFAWYRRAAVCVLPSYYETFGLSALEPMAFGTPVIAAAAGGLPEIVEHGVSGLLIPPGDENALAHAVARVLSDESLRRRLSQGARSAASRHAQATHFNDNMSLYCVAMGSGLSVLPLRPHVAAQKGSKCEDRRRRDATAGKNN
jgi:D-inositol-3-phosphate glycosyltransferase